jgi:hypothetical protein
MAKKNRGKRRLPPVASWSCWICSGVISDQNAIKPCSEPLPFVREPLCQFVKKYVEDAEDPRDSDVVCVSCFGLVQKVDHARTELEARVTDLKSNFKNG